MIFSISYVHEPTYKTRKIVVFFIMMRNVYHEQHDFCGKTLIWLCCLFNMNKFPQKFPSIAVGVLFSHQNNFLESLYTSRTFSDETSNAKINQMERKLEIIRVISFRMPGLDQ